MSKLRNYQIEACNSVLHSFQTNQRVLLILPTGCGKTIIFSALTKHITTKLNGRVLILAHRGELLEQAQAKLKRFGIESELEKAESRAGDARVVVASIQTLGKESRLAGFNRDDFDYIIIDECHHATTKTYKIIIDYFENAKVLGVTATPKRSDAKKLTDVFDDIAFSYDIRKAQSEGWLAPIHMRRVPLSIDLTDVRITAGDYNAGDVGDTLEDYLDDIINNIKRFAMNRKILIFTPTVSVAETMSEKLNAAGFRSAEVNGKSKDRDEIKEKFANNELNVVCNCMLWTEGFDEPSVDCIINLRPTRSVGLYTQIIGRGLRICEGKNDLLVLDFLWHSSKREFDILSPVDIFIDTNDTKYANEILNDNEEIDILDLADRANEAKESAEEALRRQLELSARKYFYDAPFREEDNPNIQYKYTIYGNLMMLDSIIFKDKTISMLFNKDPETEWFPFAPWHMERMSDKQEEYMKGLGINPKNIVYKGFACIIFDKVDLRRKKGLCTLKQYNLLSKRGFKNVEQWRFEDAAEMITILANNNWRLPKGLRPTTYKPEGLKVE